MSITCITTTVARKSHRFGTAIIIAALAAAGISEATFRSKVQRDPITGDNEETGEVECVTPRRLSTVERQIVYNTVARIDPEAAIDLAKNRIEREPSATELVAA